MALSCHVALDMLCQAMYGLVAGLLLSQQKPFSHRGRVVTVKGRDVVREFEVTNCYRAKNFVFELWLCGQF